MKLEHVAAPPQITPEIRHASLRRIIENGLATDRTWGDLVAVCLELGRREEAIEACGRIVDRSARARAEAALGRHGLPARLSGRPAESARPSRRGPRCRAGRESVRERADSGDGPAPIAEEVADSFRFLLYDHLPVTLIVATLTIPLVVGIGGHLTKDASPALMPLIALVPCLTVLGLVGALTRRILADATEPVDDAPALPGIGELLDSAVGFVVNAVVMTALFVGPGLALALSGVAPAWTAVPLLVAGIAAMPMAAAIRHFRRDWRAVTPSVLLPAIARGGREYGAVAALTVALFAPAVIATVGVIGFPVHLGIALVGPLTISPMFVCARILGRVLDRSRSQLAPLVGMSLHHRPTGVVTNRPGTAKRKAKRPQPASRSRTRPGHPEATGEWPSRGRKRKTGETTTWGSAGSRERTRSRRRPAAPERPASTDQARAVHALAHAASHPEGSRGQLGPSAALESFRAHDPDLAPAGSELADLAAALPGCRVVSGESRDAAGASAHTQQ